MARELPEVTSVQVADDFRLHVAFSDGLAGDVDVTPLLQAGGVFEPLRDPDFFAQAYVDPAAGTVAWPNGADVAPEMLHDQVSAQQHHRKGSGFRKAGLWLTLGAAGVAVARGVREISRP